MARKLRVLDFDIENRPLAYLGPDYTTAEITAIAARYVGVGGSVRTWLLGRDLPVDMLDGIRGMLLVASLVTGHNIRRHDLPVLNGAFMEYGLPSLPALWVSDTYSDLIKHRYISASLENLAKMLGIRTNKAHLANADWREANRLTERGIELTRQRVVGDVCLHIRVRKRLIELDLLKPPRLWTP